MKLGIKFLFGLLDLIGIFITFCLILQNNDFNIEKLLAIILVGIFSASGAVYTLYLYSYKIVFEDKNFSVRKFFITKTYEINEISGIIYKQNIFGLYTYIVKIGKKKIEISPALKNKIIADKFFEENGIFKKFPRVEY